MKVRKLIALMLVALGVGVVYVAIQAAGPAQAVDRTMRKPQESDFGPTTLSAEDARKHDVLSQDVQNLQNQNGAINGVAPRVEQKKTYINLFPSDELNPYKASYVYFGEIVQDGVRRLGYCYSTVQITSGPERLRGVYRLRGSGPAEQYAQESDSCSIKAGPRVEIATKRSDDLGAVIVGLDCVVRQGDPALRTNEDPRYMCRSYYHANVEEKDDHANVEEKVEEE